MIQKDVKIEGDPEKQITINMLFVSCFPHLSLYMSVNIKSSSQVIILNGCIILCSTNGL